MFILAIIFILNLSGCSYLYVVYCDLFIKEEEYQYEKIWYIEMYEDYGRYDAHLQCTNVYGRSKTIKREDFEGSHRYKKIHSVSDEQFICLTSFAFPYEGLTETLMVLQNPDNYVDVFNEWMVKKIELSDYSGDEVINTLTDQNIVSEFKKFINSEKTEDELIDPVPDDRKYNPKGYTISIHYEETENIYWKTMVYHYISEDYGEHIYVEQIDPETGESSKASISNYPEIYNWLSDCFANIDSQ